MFLLKPQGQKIEYSCAEGKKRTLVPGCRHPDQFSQGTWAVVPWRWETGCCFFGREPVLPQSCAVVGQGAGSSLLDCALLRLWSSLQSLGFLGHFVRHDSGLTLPRKVTPEPKCSTLGQKSPNSSLLLLWPWGFFAQ